MKKDTNNIEILSINEVLSKRVCEVSNLVKELEELEKEGSAIRQRKAALMKRLRTERLVNLVQPAALMKKLKKAYEDPINASEGCLLFNNYYSELDVLSDDVLDVFGNNMKKIM